VCCPKRNSKGFSKNPVLDDVKRGVRESGEHFREKVTFPWGGSLMDWKGIKESEETPSP